MTAFGISALEAKPWQNHSGGWRLLLPLWSKWASRYDILCDDYIFTRWAFSLSLVCVRVQNGVRLEFRSGWAPKRIKSPPEPVGNLL